MRNFEFEADATREDKIFLKELGVLFLKTPLVFIVFMKECVVSFGIKNDKDDKNKGEARLERITPDEGFLPYVGKEIVDEARRRFEIARQLVMEEIVDNIINAEEFARKVLRIQAEDGGTFSEIIEFLFEEEAVHLRLRKIAKQKILAFTKELHNSKGATEKRREKQNGLPGFTFK